MNCDPNSLSQLSSCLRCIPDGLILPVRTFLICSWAGAPGGFKMGMPTDAQWTFTDTGGGNVTAAIVGGTCPAGADGFQLGAILSPGNPQTNIIGTTTCGGSEVATGFSFNDVVLGAIRWTIGGVPVSPWSLNKSVTVSLDPAVQTYINNLSTIRTGFPTLPTLDTATTKALDIFVKGCRSDGIWANMIEVNCIVWINGGANNVQLACCPLLVGPQGGPTLGLAWTPSGFIEANATVNGMVGVVAATTTALTGIQPASTFKSANNAGLSIYISTFTATAAYDAGVFDPSAIGFLWATNDGINKIQADIWYDGATHNEVTGPGIAGFYSMSRVSSTDLRTYFANSTHAFSQIGLDAVAATTEPSTNTFRVWSATTVGNAPTAYTDRRLSFIALHDGLTSAGTQSLFNRVQALRVALGGGFV